VIITAYYLFAAPLVHKGSAGNRQWSQRKIHDPAQEPCRCIRNTEFFFDGRQDSRQDVSIDPVEQINQGNDGKPEIRLLVG